MDVGRTPGVGMVLPGICTRANRQEPVDTVFIGQAAAHAQKVRIERSWPLIPFVEVAASGIGLPNLQEGVRHRFSTVVEHAAGHNDALADRLAASPRVACEVCVFRCDSTGGGSRPPQLREGPWHIAEREPRSASPRGLINLI